MYYNRSNEVNVRVIVSGERGLLEETMNVPDVVKYRTAVPAMLR